MISALDNAIGLILDRLEDQQLLENTLILFASDNGGATYTGATDNGSLNAGKMTHFEGGINVPLIISWKNRIPAGTLYHEPVSLMDLFSTTLAASGMQGPADRVIDGVDLLPYLTGQKGGVPHKVLFWRTDFNKSARYENWKFIWNTRDDQLFLFDLKNDKAEKVNLVPGNPELIRKLMNDINQWEKGLKTPSWPGVMEIHFEINGEETWWAI
jgi:arylsulfatase A-like enzyme